MIHLHAINVHSLFNHIHTILTQTIDKMEELKTLKDIEVSGYKHDDIIIKNELKAEAIKHIRAMFKTYHYDAAYSMMYFFNITEEDLK